MANELKQTPDFEQKKSESCEYDGESYGEGARSCQEGKVMECRNGEWFDTGETCDD